jgi:hypothetical protein
MFTNRFGARCDQESVAAHVTYVPLLARSVILHWLWNSERRNKRIAAGLQAKGFQQSAVGTEVGGHCVMPQPSGLMGRDNLFTRQEKR